MMESCHIYPFLHAFLFILIHSCSPDVACQSLCPVECSHRKRSGAVLPFYPCSHYHAILLPLSWFLVTRTCHILTILSCRGVALYGSTLRYDVR